MERVCKTDLNVINILHQMKGQDHIKINGYLITPDSDRYDNFYKNGTVCAECGLQATYAAVERTKGSKRYHVNVYGTRADGKDVLLTKDHIYPKALGGYNSLNNYQVLCECCNSKKKNTTNLNLDEAVEKGYTSYERADLAQKLLEAKQRQSELKVALNAANQEVCKIATEFNKTGQKESKREFF